MLTAQYDRLLETITRRPRPGLRALLHVQLMDDGAVITISKFASLNAYLSSEPQQQLGFVAELDRTNDIVRSIRRALNLIGEK